MKKIFTIISLLFLTLICCKTKQKAKSITKLQGNIFGTTYLIMYDNPKIYQKSIDSIFSAVNKSLSTYIPNSDISKINRNEPNIIVDDLFVEVFEKAKRIHKETDGYFDPTLGQLINAYGFGS
ncbi:MAG: thiamine biosynthesis protein ApbE, partial [Polaribacter sp.]